MNNTDRAWAEVSKNAIRNNFMIVKNQIASHAKIMGILKADGYGHNIVPSAVCLEESGVDWIGVATFPEAMQLRSADIHTPILTFSRIPLDDVITAAEQRITVSGVSYEHISELNAKLEGIRNDLVIDIHIKIDTGLNRTGMLLREDNLEEIVQKVKAIKAMKNVRVTGIFSHLACPNYDTPFNVKFTKLQYSRFASLLERLSEDGVDVGIRHICGSLAAVNFPEMQLDMIRAGVLLFGITAPNFNLKKYPLVQAMTLKARVIHVHTLKKGEYISYGCLFQAPEDMEVALLSIGYADGYRGTLTNKSHVLINGTFCDTVGKICMDYTMVAVEKSTVKVGDTVVLMGYDQDKWIPASYLAQLTGEVEAEVICNLNKRIPRLYI